jgi:crotonobetainyl-CoA:carnitine CoA-transferase CaiB-like acyl-CoA transferase
MGHRAASHALEDLTVIDLTHVRAGPVCVRQLGDWGANVIKVDRPGNPRDFSRRHESDFQNNHRNKRSIALDLKSAAGVAVLHRLVERADIVVENYRPDVKRRLGIDYERLRIANPRIIYCSISAFGQDGPYRDRPGLDQIIQGMSGFMSITGEPTREPMRAGIPIADISAGIFGAMGILVALYERERSNEGQWVQTSLLESQLFMLDFQAARYLIDGHVPNRVGNAHPTGPATNAYPTKDGYVNISPLQGHWKGLCRALGREDLIDHPNYATQEARRLHSDELNELITGITRTLDAQTLLSRLEAADVPGGPINTIAEAFADPQVEHVKMVQTVESPSLGTLPLMRQPVQLSRTPSTLTVSCPEYAEHTNEVLEEFGYTPHEIAALREAGVAE